MRYKKYRIQYQDTVQGIAQRFYGDVSSWFELVEYNNLEYPYIVDTNAEKLENLEHLVTIGDELIIPIEDDLATYDVSKINKHDSSIMMDWSLGMDIDMLSGEQTFKNHGTSDEITELDADPSTHDLSLRKGVSNMAQALTARLLTARGSLLLHPDYGSELHNLFGKALPEQALLIETEITRCLMSDSRVKLVTQDNYTIQGNEYRGAFTVDLESVEKSLRFVLEADTSGIIARFE